MLGFWKHVSWIQYNVCAYCMAKSNNHCLTLTSWHLIVIICLTDMQTANKVIDLKVPLYGRGGISEDLKSIDYTYTVHHSFLFISPAHLHVPWIDSKLGFVCVEDEHWFRDLSITQTVDFNNFEPKNIRWSMTVGENITLHYLIIQYVETQKNVDLPKVCHVHHQPIRSLE